ncbi:MAG: low molecular weight phosphotyrosine protein phosphatase [Clostridia bacterium]|nr:low molecular weight phosphotyrosine protein phosphatase [Deltaproteobacteria bacterium]
MIRICFVCLGNICRSPTAEGVMRHLVDSEGLGEAIQISSAGTGAWHVGEHPDPRSRATAERHGVKLTSRARHFGAESFDEADYVVAMDSSNLKNLNAIARNEEDRAKISLFRDFDLHSPKGSNVPDPYAGGQQGFENVYNMVESASQGLLTHLRTHHELE